MMGGPKWAIDLRKIEEPKKPLKNPTNEPDTKGHQ